MTILRLTAALLLCWAHVYPQDGIILYTPGMDQLMVGSSWQVRLSGSNAYRNAELAPQVTALERSAAYRLGSHQDHRLMLMSMPHKLARSRYRLIIRGRITIDETFAEAQTYPLEVALYDGQQKLGSQLVDLPAGKSRQLHQVIDVNRIRARARLALVFDNRIKSVTVDSLIITWQSTAGGPEYDFPANFLALNKLLYVAGDTVRAQWHDSGLQRQSAIATEWTLFDHQQQELDRGKGAFARPTAGPGALGPGWYTMQTGYAPAAEAKYRSWTAFTVIPDTARRGPADDSPFGIHVEANAEGLRTARLLGARWVRLHGADVLKWKTVQPEMDRWVWPDTVLNMFHAGGMRLLATLGKTPQWASSRPEAEHYPWRSYYFGPSAYLPADMARWEKYIQSVQVRYDDIIDYWEPWNEPDIHFLVSDERGKAQNYSLLFNSAAEVLHRGRNNKVVGPSLAYYLTEDKPVQNSPFPQAEYARYRDSQFLARLTPLLNGQGPDVFSFHHYSSQNRRVSLPWLLAQDEALDAKLAAASGLVGGDGEIWITEYNVVSNMADVFAGGFTRLASQMCAEQIDLLARGVRRIFTYNAFNHDQYASKFDNFYDPPFPTPMFTAYAVMTSLLDSMAFSKQFARGAVREYKFPGSGGSSVEIYVNTGAATALKMEAAGTLITAFGSRKEILAGSEIAVPSREIVYYLTEK